MIRWNNLAELPASIDALLDLAATFAPDDQDAIPDGDSGRLEMRSPLVRLRRFARWALASGIAAVRVSRRLSLWRFVPQRSSECLTT